jgi:hypothetical protein
MTANVDEKGYPFECCKATKIPARVCLSAVTGQTKKARDWLVPLVSSRKIDWCRKPESNRHGVATAGF